MRKSFSERLEKRNCNHVFWAPTGQFIVLAGLRNMSGALEFIDTNDFISMNTTDHYSCSDVEWDPTGRYVVTAVSFWKTKVFFPTFFRHSDCLTTDIHFIIFS